MKNTTKHCFKIWSPFKRNDDLSPRYMGEAVSSSASKALVSFLRQLRDPSISGPECISYIHSDHRVRIFKHRPSGNLFCVSR